MAYYDDETTSFANWKDIKPWVLDAQNAYGDINVANRLTIIDLKSLYGFNNLRDVKNETGSATVTNSVGDGEYALATTANGADVAELLSAEFGRYTAGFLAAGGIGWRVDAAPNGHVYRWGLRQSSTGNGVYFGEDDTGVFAAILRDGSETKIYQSNWNHDTLDGSGDENNPSGITLDTTAGYVYNTVFGWYGYGPIYFSIRMFDSDLVYRDRLVHVYEPPSGQTSLKTPNMPLFAEVDNNGSAEARTGVVTGRTYEVFGGTAGKRRVTGEYRLSQGSIDTTFVPLVSFRLKDAYKILSVKVEGWDILADADLIIQVRVGGSLTGESFGSLSDTADADTGVEADTSATAISNGIPVYTTLLDSSGGGNTASGKTSSAGFDFDLPQGDPVTICARRLSGTGATASTVFRVSEEW